MAFPAGMPLRVPLVVLDLRHIALVVSSSICGGSEKKMALKIYGNANNTCVS
jgi:hypothetical protein